MQIRRWRIDKLFVEPFNVSSYYCDSGRWWLNRDDGKTFGIKTVPNSSFDFPGNLVRPSRKTFHVKPSHTFSIVRSISISSFGQITTLASFTVPFPFHLSFLYSLDEWILFELFLVWARKKANQKEVITFNFFSLISYLLVEHFLFFDCPLLMKDGWTLACYYTINIFFIRLAHRLGPYSCWYSFIFFFRCCCCLPSSLFGRRVKVKFVFLQTCRYTTSRHVWRESFTTAPSRSFAFLHQVD